MISGKSLQEGGERKEVIHGRKMKWIEKISSLAWKG